MGLGDNEEFTVTCQLYPWRTTPYLHKIYSEGSKKAKFTQVSALSEQGMNRHLERAAVASPDPREESGRAHHP